MVSVHNPGRTRIYIEPVYIPMQVRTADKVPIQYSLPIFGAPDGEIAVDEPR